MSDATVPDIDLSAFDIGPLRRRRSFGSVAVPVALGLTLVTASWMLADLLANLPRPDAALADAVLKPVVVAGGPLVHPDAPLAVSAATPAESDPRPAALASTPSPVALHEAAVAATVGAGPVDAATPPALTAPPVVVATLASEPATPSAETVPLPVPAPRRAPAVAEAEPLPVALPVQPPAVPDLADAVPLPQPRPPELRAPVARPPFRTASRSVAGRRAPGVPPAAPDNRNFFEKLFGFAQPGGAAPSSVLAYAAPETTAVAPARSAIASTPAPYDRQTAVYDIAAHTVYMPDGSRLEAHSGLGASLDDPRRVHERNRGATPPHLYELTPREQLFHGVRALRLTPVGDGPVFGRTGLLAHTFMLGPNGDSNGCVSFRNYNAFLQAYANGEIRHLAVVAGRS